MNAGCRTFVRLLLQLTLVCVAVVGITGTACSADVRNESVTADHTGNTGAASGRWTPAPPDESPNMLDRILENPTFNRVTEWGLAIVLGGVFILITVLLTGSALFSTSALWCWTGYPIATLLWFIILFNIAGSTIGPALTGLFILGFPVARLLIPRSQWFKTHMQKRPERK